MTKLFLGFHPDSEFSSRCLVLALFGARACLPHANGISRWQRRGCWLGRLDLPVLHGHLLQGDSLSSFLGSHNLRRNKRLGFSGDGSSSEFAAWTLGMEACWSERSDLGEARGDAEMALRVKIADHPHEFEGIARLDYATFVEEIPQHESNADRVLVDKFHRENRYFICLEDEIITGMVALRNQRPFSLDQKIPKLDAYLQPGESLCEIRLLSIIPGRRHGLIFAKLMNAVFTYCHEQGFDRGLISGPPGRREPRRPYLFTDIPRAK